jgi:hypothetical protein
MRLIVKWLLKRRGYGTTKEIPDVTVIYLEHKQATKGVALIFTEQARFFADEAGENLAASCGQLRATMGKITYRITHVGALGSVVEVDFEKPVANNATVKLCVESVTVKGKFKVAEEYLLRWVSEKMAKQLIDLLG